MNVKRVGEFIKQKRKEKKLTQKELAEKLSITDRAISKWERNEAKPDIDKLIAISKLFNVSIDYLLSYEIDYSNVDELIEHISEYLISLFEEEILGDLKNDL